MCGVTMPLHSAEHMYIVTGRIEGVHPDLPVMRDPDGFIYFKEEVGGLVMGGFEPQCQAVGHERHPREFRVPAAAGRLGPVRDPDGERAAARARAGDGGGQEVLQRSRMLHAGQQFHSRRSARTAQLVRRRRLQLDGHRQSAAAPAGRWRNGSSTGEPTMDLWPVDIRRFASLQQQSRAGCRTASRKRSACTTRCHGRTANWTARGRFAVRRSMIGSPRKARASARKMGWERANYFAAPARRPRTSMRSADRTGSTRLARDERARAKPSRCST